jgi:hypothetical protein
LRSDSELTVSSRNDIFEPQRSTLFFGPFFSSRLLRLELIELALLLFDLRLLFGHAALKICILLLPCLHLIADQCATEKTYGRTDSGSSTGVAGRGADDAARARPGQSSIHRAFFSRR